jgi:hypothetical protein
MSSWRPERQKNSSRLLNAFTAAAPARLVVRPELMLSRIADLFALPTVHRAVHGTSRI